MRAATIKMEVMGTCKRIVRRLKSFPAKVLFEHTDIQAWDYHYLNSLAHYYSHQVYYRAFPSRCLPPGNIIEFDHIKAKPRLGGYIELDFPTVGFAATDLDDLTLRVCVIEQQNLKRFIEIQVQYERSCPERQIATTRGFLNAVTNAIAGNKINVWRMYNLTSEATLSNEFGFVRFFAELPEKLIGEKTDKTRDRLRSSIEANMSKNPDLRYSGLKQISVSPLRAESVFVSLKIESGRKNDLVRVLMEIAREFGLPEQNIIIIEEYIEPLTERIISQVERCDAMICIFSGMNGEVDYTWLEIEYALACAFRKKKVRLVDTATPKRPRFAKGTPSIEFNSGKDEEHLKSKMRAAFHAILD